MGGQQQSSLSAVFRLHRPAVWLLWCVKTARFATGKFGITFGTGPRSWVNASVYPAIFAKLVTWRKCLLNFSTKGGGSSGCISFFLKGIGACNAENLFSIILASPTPSGFGCCFYPFKPFCSLLCIISFLKIKTSIPDEIRSM